MTDYQKLKVSELKKLAKKHNLVIKNGSGKNGGIIKKDLIKALESTTLPSLPSNNKYTKTTYVLTIFNENTAQSKDFHKGFMIPTKTITANTQSELKLRFYNYLKSNGESNIKDVVQNIKTHNPLLKSAYITIYDESISEPLQ